MKIPSPAASIKYSGQCRFNASHTSVEVESPAIYQRLIHDFNAAQVARTLHVPDSLLVGGVLGLGYCANRAILPAPRVARTVFAEAFGLPWCRPAGEEDSEWENPCPT